MDTVGDLMQTDLITAPPSSTVAEAATTMGQRRVGACLIMEGDQVLGIFTERDIVRALGQHFDAAEHPVTEWMTIDPTMVPADTPIREALQLMIDGGYRHLPITVEGRVAGMVSMRDLSRWLGSA